MNKGDKIIDVRDNSVHIVECVDVYDTVTLVFTEGKKYIPKDSVISLNQIINENAESIKNELVNIQLEARKELKDKFGIDLEK